MEADDKTMHLSIHTSGKAVEIDTPTGTNLADAILAAGFPLNLSCGGFGSCGRCGVVVRSGHFETTGAAVSPGGRTVASCMTTCGEGPAEIEIPPSALFARNGRILHDYRMPRIDRTPTVRVEETKGRHTVRARTTEGWKNLWATDDSPLPLYGLAVDVGTTTVASAIVDLTSGKILGHASMYNQQMQRAEDVASRIAFCRDEASVRLLHQLVIDHTINVLIEQHRADGNVDPERIVRIALAGNTTMMHLVAGLSPSGMGTVPFTPIATVFPTLLAGDLGIRAHVHAVVDLLPSSSAYIGADVVCDLLVAKLEQGPHPALLIDIGTNGEIVLATEHGLYACATAAGPAFEGAGLSHGCRAANGAIDHVHIGPDLDFRLDVIGGGAPCGLCGSAVVDFLAVARRRELLNEFGRLDCTRLKQCGRFAETMNHRGKVKACTLSERTVGGPEPITLSEADIEQVLKAKAAIQAGIRVLLEQRQIEPESLKRLVIAGGFGHYLNLDNAAAIGLLPGIDPSRIDVIGNGSLAGAIASLLDESILPQLEIIARRPSIVELNRIPSFQDHFIDALRLDAFHPAIEGDSV